MKAASRSFLLLLCLAPCARAANVANFLTLNCLHLGWNGPALKNTRIRAELARAPSFDAILLQEVMNGADLSAVNPYPRSYIAQSGLLGHSNYKETYAIIIETGAFANVGGQAQYGDTVNFSRPPFGVRLTTRNGGKSLWLIDYHAVFGGSSAVRRAEVARVQTAATAFRDNTRATQIVAGDWNWRGDVAPLSGFGFEVVRPTATFTSLKGNGNWSQAYDHFALFEGGISTISYNGAGASACTVVVPINGTADWRTNASDHVPVYCSFSY